MKAYQDVFRRVEKKYFLTPKQYESFFSHLQDFMQVDLYGKHTICNLYYDTEDFALIRASLEKPAYREKIRLRSYGTPRPEDTVFLELKKKVQGTVYKRRTPMALVDAAQYTVTRQLPPGPGQILKEIDYCFGRYHPTAKVFLAYDRIALFGLEDPDLRVTFDFQIRWRDTQLDLAHGDWGRELLTKPMVLMEVKLTSAMPLWFCHLLSAYTLYPTTFSKYGTCYRQELSTKQGGIICA